MLAFGCNTVFTFYTLYLSLCSAFFLFDWQIAIISSKMVAPTLRHRIAIRLARGMHLSSAVQADVSTCSGVVRLLLLSLQLRKPSGIGLLWVVGRKFLFFSFSVPCDPLMFPLVHSLFMLDWSVKFSALYFWIVLDDLMPSTTSCYQIRSTGFFSWKICWLLGILGAFGYPRCCAVLRLPGGLSVFFLSSETWCMGIRLCCFCDFIFGWDP